MASQDAVQSLRRLLKAIVASRNPFYAKKLANAGFTEFDSLTIEDFQSRCPFTTKAEIAEDHRSNPPFGTNLGKPIGMYSRVCKTSGTSGERIMWPDTQSSWDSMLEVWDKIYLAAGIKANVDRVYFAFSFGPFIGFWTAFESAVRMGCMAFPGGGARSSERIEEIITSGITVLCCTPTYAQRLGQLISECGREHNVSKVIVAGEPGGSIPEVSSKISSLWDGAKVFDHHGMTEVGPVSVEVPNSPGNLCIVPGFHFAEVLDLESGMEVSEGERGELVLTTLRRDDTPVLRYRTGDLVCKRHYEIDGQLVLGFEGGVLGRIDDMVVVRGVNLYPGAIDAVVCRHSEVENYQVVISSDRSMREVTLNVELNEECDTDETVERIADSLRLTFALRLPVMVVPLGSLPDNEFKATRWVKR
ncbi:MAG: phenylacetate--CoA ligase [Verrucomicrobiaceae bacterium]|nr:phenylacetate--CoA ligase [Verrucomicrobiaceae bacterium]